MSILMTQATPELFQKAASGDQDSLNEILSLLQNAVQSNLTWSTVAKLTFQNGLNNLAAQWAEAPLNEQQAQILRYAMLSGLSALKLRKGYAALAAIDFAAAPNPSELAAVTGIQDMTVPVLTASRRWSLLAAAKEGAILYCVTGSKAIFRKWEEEKFQNEQKTEISRTVAVLQMENKEEKKVLPADLLGCYMILVENSPLAELLTGKGDRPDCNDLSAMRKLENSLLRACTLPANFLNNLIAAPRRASSVKAKAAAPAPAATTEPPTRKNWDEARSVRELFERLKNLSSLELDHEADLENLEKILADGAGKEDQAEYFASSLAYLQKMAGDSLKQWLEPLIVKLAPEAKIWQDKVFCAEITDQLSGKIAPFWLSLTLTACGPEFLANLCLALPGRLWIPVEKILQAQKSQQVLIEKVTAALAANKASADMLHWLWRSKLQNLKDLYLTKPDMLFKVLHQDAKGNYLKTQRDLRKLMLENSDFQRQLTQNGKRENVVEFIRCIKHMPLLDPGERQSLLVSINSLYPEYISEIEEKHQGPVKIALGRLTSIRGYKRREAELKYLQEVEIPANATAIAVARARGDLRENSEFKAAKDEQAVLNARFREFSSSLAGLETTDFRNVVVNDIVVPGCTVVITYHNDESEKTFHILGLLDTETEKDIISFATPMGKLLVGQKVGYRFTAPNGEGAHIKEIRPLSQELLDYIQG